jgi:iron complex outermembrane receptor protein
MYIKQMFGMLGICHVFSLTAQTKNDSINSIILEEVVVQETRRRMYEKKTSLPVVKLTPKDLEGFSPTNFVHTLTKIPGIQSMDIGAGFSKPVIRGMAFNRIAVSENGIKQEGQQWGADHGLEIDAFNVEEVNVIKGPSSLAYGSDAIGGAIEILPAVPPAKDCFLGEFTGTGRTVNNMMGGSVMLGLKRHRNFMKFRYSEKQYGDYKIPADTIVYLTQKMPVYGGKLKNTAGVERNASIFYDYRYNRYKMNASASSVYQKMGFFPGAHGIPDINRIKDDENSRNIDFPYSKVNHVKLSTHQQFDWHPFQFGLDLGYQYNLREEWSYFHTHYDNQAPPLTDPDKELEFRLSTFSGTAKLRWLPSTIINCTLGYDFQIQRNTIGGYSFLLPRYDRFTSACFFLGSYSPSNTLHITGGIRYDWGYMNVQAFEDKYLADYLNEQGYPDTEIEAYRWRSNRVERRFNDFSFSLGMVWFPDGGRQHLLKMNIGRSFRLPSANELSSNGVHHGTFRHEQGDSSLASESGWQADISYSYRPHGNVELHLSPFVSLYDNYIFLTPTGEWSVLPHAGQIYRYHNARAVFCGGEMDVKVYLPGNLSYQLKGQYVYTYNLDEHTALSFSPQPIVNNVIAWHYKKFRVHAEVENILPQHWIARNEVPTPGSTLLHTGVRFFIPFRQTKIQCLASIRNILNTRYYNHLSYYRRIEIPEAGRNIEITIRIPFKKNFI